MSRFHVPSTMRHTRNLPVTHGAQGCPGLVPVNNRLMYCGLKKGHDGPHAEAAR